MESSALAVEKAAATEEPEKGGKPATWTEGEKCQFLLKIIAQLSNGATPKFATIDMPGRSTKSLTHMWSKIRSDVAAMGAADGTEGAEGAVKSQAAKKRIAADGEATAENGGLVTPKKKKVAAPKIPRTPKTPKTPKVKKAQTPKGKKEPISEEKVDEAGFKSPDETKVESDENDALEVEH